MKKLSAGITTFIFTLIALAAILHPMPASAQSNEKAEITSPNDGDTITKADFDPKLNMTWNQGTNVDRYVLEVRGVGVNNNTSDDNINSQSDDSWLDSMASIFGSNRIYTKRISAKEDNFELALNNFTKARNVQITLKTYFEDSENSDDFDSDSIVVRNEASWEPANRKIMIQSPQMFDEVSSIPTIEFDPGQNVKSAELKLYPSFTFSPFFKTKIEDPESGSVSLSSADWEKATSFVTIEITTKFNNGRSARDSVMIRNSVRNGNFDPVTITSPDNGDTVSPNDFPLNVTFENTDNEDISTLRVSLFSFNLEEENPQGFSELEGKINTVKAFKTFSLSKSERQEGEFMIDPDDWNFDEEFITILLRTKFKNGPTKDNFVTVKNVESNDDDGDGDTPTTRTITISDNMRYSPTRIEVDPGDTVTVKNNDNITHTVTSDTTNSSRKFDTGNISAGSTRTFKAPTTPGTYGYHCKLHPEMEATLVVKDNGNGGDDGDNSGDFDVEKAKSDITSPTNNKTVRTLPLKVRWNNASEPVETYKLEVYYTDISADETCRTTPSTSSTRVDCDPDGSADESFDNIDADDRSYDLTDNNIDLPDNRIMVIRLHTKFSNGDEAYDDAYVKSKPENTNASANNVVLANVEKTKTAEFTSPSYGQKINKYPVKFTWTKAVNAKEVVFRGYFSKYDCTTIECAESHKNEFKQAITYIRSSPDTTTATVDPSIFDKKGFYNHLFSIETVCQNGGHCGVDWVFLRSDPEKVPTGPDTPANVEPDIYSPANNSSATIVPNYVWTTGRNIKSLEAKITVSGGTLYNDQGKKVSSVSYNVTLDKNATSYSTANLFNDKKIDRSTDHRIRFTLTTRFNNDKKKTSSVNTKLLNSTPAT